MKTSSTLLVLSLALVWSCSNPSTSTSSTSSTTVSDNASMAHGADIGWLTQLEANGYSWVDSTGTTTDCLALLKADGVDSVRLRVMVDPAATNYMAGSYPMGYCDDDSAGKHLVALAKRCQAAGITRFFIDFHFSDTWASDESQTPPAAWANDTLAEFETDLSNHVTSVLTDLKTAGITPEWVQLGNEITDGILFGSNATGKVAGTTGWTNLVALLNAGYTAVKAVNSSTKVVLHLDKGGESSQFEWWFGNYFTNGGKCDVIGMSFYPYWQSSDTVAMLSANMNTMVSLYGKPVMVCEVGGQYNDPTGTKTLLDNVKAAVASVSGGNGLGFFYWEPESNPAYTGYSLGASSAYSGKELQLTSAMTGFN